MRLRCGTVTADTVKKTARKSYTRKAGSSKPEKGFPAESPSTPSLELGPNGRLQLVHLEKSLHGQVPRQGPLKMISKRSCM